MGQSGAGVVNTPFSLTGASSAPVSTPFSIAPNTSGYNSAMDTLNNSTSGLNTNWQAPTLTPFQAPTLSAVHYNPLSGSMFSGTGGGASSASANGGGSPSPGDFFSNVWNGLKSAGSSVLDFLNRDSSSVANVWGGSGGILDNFKGIADLYQGNAQKAVSESPNVQSPGSLYTQGWSNPSQTPTWSSNFGRLTGSTNPIVNAVGGFAFGGFNDPLSYVPVGGIAKLAFSPVKGAYNMLKGGTTAAETAAHVAEPVAQTVAHTPMDDNLASLANTYHPNDFNFHDVSAPQMAKPNPMESQGNVFEHQMGQGVGDQFAQQQAAINPHAQPLSDLNQEIANLQNEHSGLAQSLAESANSANGEGIQKILQDAQVRRPLPNEPYYNEFKALDPAIQKLFVAGNADKGAVGGFSLPKALAGSAPRYKGNPLTFNNELDKALYIVGNANKVSKNDGAFMNLLKSYTRMGDSQIRAAGQDVRSQIGNYVDGSKPGEKVPLPPLYKDSQVGGTVIANNKSGVSLDEFANGQGKSVAEILDHLNNSKGGYTAADFADHPALQDHQQALQMLQELRDAVQAEYDGWAQTAATSAPDHFSLGHDENFGNLLNHIGGAPIGEEPTLARDATGVAKSPFTPTTPQPVRNPFKQQLGEMFTKDFGLTSEEKAAVSNRDNMQTLLQHQVPNEFANLQKLFPQLSSQDLSKVGHMIEGTMPADPKLQPFIDAYNKMRNEGVSVGGVKLGTQAEKASVSPNGRAVLQNERNNYFRHIYSENPKQIEQLAQKSGKSFSTGASLNQERKFETLRDALDAGAHPYLNPLTAGAERMIQGGKAIIDNQMFQDLAKSGSIKKIVNPANKAEATSEQLSMFDHALDTKGVDYKANDVPAGWQMSAIPQLQGWAIRPDLERALQARLVDTTPNPLFGLLQKSTSKINRLTTANSLVHGHNILSNAYLGGLNPMDIARTASRIKAGTYNDIMQRAMKSGAISADTHGSLAEGLDKRFAPDMRSPFQKVKDGLGYAYHGALWDADKFLRASLFEKYTKQGLSDTEAAAKVQKNMVDYGNLTPFEKKYMTTLLPFYTWKKGNIPLQAQHWLFNTPRQVAYVHGLNAVQNSINGQNAGDDGKLDIGTLPDGEHLKLDPYYSGMDPIKIANDGILPYLFTSSNPYLKEAVNEIANKAYYPSASLAPNGKESMANTQIRKDGAPLGDNIMSTLGHVGNQFVPSGGLLGAIAATALGAKSGRMTDLINGRQSGGNIPTTPMTPTEIIGKALGAFTSRDKPAMDAYYQQKDAQTAHKAQDVYKKAHGQSVSKQDWAYDYKKIPFPAGYGN